MRQDADLLNQQELAAIGQARAGLLETKDGNDPVAIKQAVKALETASETFILHRMNAGIKRAVAGHRIDEY
jgi:molecular chaperone HscA